MMNLRFRDVLNEMVGLRTKLTSFWDEVVYKGPGGRRLAGWAISSLEEFIIENTNDNVKDFDYEYGVRFQQHRTYKYKGIRPQDYFTHMRADKEDGFCDGLGRILGSIMMKILAF
jgi:hypothetical protein